MSETKDAKLRKPPNKHQPTKAEMEEVIVIPATLDQLAGAVLAGGLRDGKRNTKGGSSNDGYRIAGRRCREAQVGRAGDDRSAGRDGHG